MMKGCNLVEGKDKTPSCSATNFLNDVVKYNLLDTYRPPDRQQINEYIQNCPINIPCTDEMIKSFTKSYCDLDVSDQNKFKLPCLYDGVTNMGESTVNFQNNICKKKN